MRAITRITTAACLGLSLLLPACGGGGATTYNENKTVSLGQELIDLKRARDGGAISDSEYHHLREQVIKKAGK